MPIKTTPLRTHMGAGRANRKNDEVQHVNHCPQRRARFFLKTGAGLKNRNALFMRPNSRYAKKSRVVRSGVLNVAAPPRDRFGN